MSAADWRRLLDEIAELRWRVDELTAERDQALARIAELEKPKRRISFGEIER